MRTMMMLLLAGTAMPALAAAADDGGDAAAEITVTASRQPYRGDFTVQETPAAITTIDQTWLNNNNVLRLTDALDLNASVARQNNFGGLWDAFAVRGFAGDENLPSGYLVNGYNNGRGFGGSRDVSGVEKIEVLKGPQAALYGRGEPGGVINIVTKKADFDTRGTIGVQAGSWDRQRVDADVNLAAGETAAVRLIGFYEDAGSFRGTRSQRWGFTPSVLVKLGEATALTYELELTRAEAQFDRGVVAINGQLGAMSRRTFLGEPGDGPLDAEVTGHQLQLSHDFNADWSILIGGQHRDTRLTGFSTEAELAGSRQRLGRDGRSLSRQRRFRDYDAEHQVLRGEVQGRLETGGLKHRVLFGADYDRFENSQLFLRFRPAAIGATTTAQQSNDIDIFAPVYGRFPLPTPGPQTNRLDTQKAFGLYVQDQIDLGGDVQIRLGGRYDDFSLTTLNRANGVASARDFNRFSPQAGIVYEANPTLSFYAAYGEGFRANIGADVAGRIFNPETSRSAEIGTKLNLLDGKLTGTIALFNLTKDNVLAADPANPGFSVPIGRARSRGLEVDLNGKLPGDVDLLLSYAFVDATARAAVLDPNFSLNIRVGDRLINIPRHQFNVQAAKAIAITDDVKLTLGGGVQHTGGRLGETATQFFLPAYTLARLFARADISERVEIFAEVSNLFNATYYTNSFAQLWVQPGQPRAGTVAVRFKF
ncbi:TonB-dependent siderophore receptor [Sandarakinorhabdus cyanobacteriorum]|uniref:TonB-dependent siderophore receptor n=1 Tax=Sandarakinorhabdus cyanobacteriorum TaxID=1981098 RepID=A0A255Y334_9SPHN|nr:TonB-dependent siderophore receptor [Sandarakinorhabdus cyanobacteriorum]